MTRNTAMRGEKVYEMDLDTLATVKLSDGSTIDVDPQYSHNGGKVAFRSYSALGEKSRLSLMNTDGSGRVAFSDPAGDATNASILDNVVYNNTKGIYTFRAEVIAGNRVYFNTDVGIEHDRNRLFVAGGGTGKGFVYDARTGALIREPFPASPTSRGSGPAGS